MSFSKLLGSKVERALKQACLPSYFILGVGPAPSLLLSWG